MVLARVILTGWALLGLPLFLGPAFAQKVPLTANAQTSTLGFISYTRLFQVEGTFRGWEAKVNLNLEDPSRSSVRVEVDMASLDTGISARDRHLRGKDFFWVARYPRATFVSQRVWIRSPEEVSLVGDLTLRGVTQRVEVPVRLVEEGKGLHARGKFALDRFAFGVSYQPRFFLLPSIRSRVDVFFDVSLPLAEPLLRELRSRFR